MKFEFSIPFPHPHRVSRRRDDQQDDTMKLVGSAAYNDEAIN